MIVSCATLTQLGLGIYTFCIDQFKRDIENICMKHTGVHLFDLPQWDESNAFVWCKNLTKNKKKDKMLNKLKSSHPVLQHLGQ